MKTATFYEVRRLVTIRDTGAHVTQPLGIFESLDRAKSTRAAIMEEVAPAVKAVRETLFMHVDCEIVPVEVTLEG